MKFLVGWIVSFLLDVRHAGPSSGYVSAGFFGGIMLGRVILLWVTEKIGERRVIYLYSFMILRCDSSYFHLDI
jgi:fucose permease